MHGFTQADGKDKNFWVERMGTEEGSWKTTIKRREKGNEERS